MKETRKPKTRAQLRKEEEDNRKETRTKGNTHTKTTTNKASNNKQNERVNQTFLNEIEDTQKENRKGWTNIADVKKKLKDLETEYKKVNDETIRSRIRKLIDVYEKQVKAINIKAQQKNKESYKNQNEQDRITPIYTVDEEEQSEYNETVMSDETRRTVNSKIVTPTKLKANNRIISSKINEENNNNRTAVLESLGKTRSSSIKRTHNENNKEKKKNCGNDENDDNTKTDTKMVTQDGSTLMSEITMRNVDENKNKNNNGTENKEKNTHNEKKDGDDVTVMSNDTLKTDSKVENQNSQQECSKDMNEKVKDIERNNINDRKNINGEEEKTKINEMQNSGQSTKDMNKQNDPTDEKTIMSEETKGNDHETEKMEAKVNEKKTNNINDIQGKSAMKVKNPYIKRITNSKDSTNDTTQIEPKNHQTYAQTTINKAVNDKNTENTGKNQVQENVKYIRVRFSFVGENTNEPKNKVIRRILYEAMQCAKTIDTKAALMAWKEKEMLKNLNGNEILLYNDDKITKYIDMPTTYESINKGETYYSNGMRIKTDINVSDFVEKWNNEKYNQEKNSPFIKWKAVRPAEMQKHDTSHPIGYLAGTTERGLYDTLITSLIKEFNNDIEISYQTVFQPGVSQRVWNYAQKTARKQYRNETSKQYKLLKFAMPPSALVIYTHDSSKTKAMRRELIKKYGTLVNDAWPIMKDQSRMRFIPIMKGYLNDKEVKQQLYEHLKHQATSKAGEVKLDFRYYDVTSEKQYFNNKSLEQIIHAMSTKENKNVPLFKHITKKWSQRHDNKELEIAVATALINEATAALRALKNTLIKTYGHEARNHFIDSRNERKWTRTTMKRNYTAYNDDWDEEVGEFIKNSNNKDKLSKVLIEGMELVMNQEKETKSDKTRKIIEKEHIAPKDNQKEDENNNDKEEVTKNKENKVKNTQEMIEIDESETQKSMENHEDESTLSNANSYMKQKAWDEITIVGEYEKITPATKEEIRKVQNTLEKHKI